MTVAERIASNQLRERSMNIKATKRGFDITRAACVVCGEPPFGQEYCCGHSQAQQTSHPFVASPGDGCSSCGKLRSATVHQPPRGEKW